MAVIHISEAEAARDFAALLARVREGAEVVIDKEDSPPIVLRIADPPRSRTLSESIALAKKHEEETGEAPVLDPDFAADVEERIKNRRPWNPPAWD